MSPGAATGEVLSYNGTSFVPTSVGSGTVTSVATNSTLTGGPITITGTLGINLGNTNTWTASQIHTGGITLSTTGMTTNAFIGPNFTGTATLLPSVTWTNVTYQNSWADFSTTFYGMSYFKDSIGMVHLRGAAHNASSSGAIIFALPAGFRPIKQITFACDNGSGTYQLGNITSVGNVFLPTASTNMFISSEIVFMAEA